MEPPESLSFPLELAGLQSADEPGRLELLWHDHALQFLLGVTCLINLALIGYLVVRYDTLPDPLPLHFDAAGWPDRIEAKNSILALPGIGFVVLAANTVLGILSHRRERAATILLAAGALSVQVLLWLAAIIIVSGPA